MSRMMVYAWYDADGNKGETKFGDHFVSDDKLTLDEAIQHTINYIKHFQFPRRGPHFESGRVQYFIWDISKYAKHHNKFHKASSIDDVIRPFIGHRGTVGKEFHSCSFDEVIIRVNLELSKIGQPLMTAELSTTQHNAAVETIGLFKENNIILAELCARFGKTIWSGAVAVEMDTDLVIVASYVKTVFTSFAKDLTSFNQFANYVHVDSGEPDYQQKITDALDEGKKVIAYLSMANGTNRQSRIDFLFCWDVETLLIIDEADFGSHKAKQADPLIEATDGVVKTIIMTGTNSDRAITHWPVDQMLSVVYPELIIQKKLSQRNKTKPRSKLTHFKINKNRDLLVPGFSGYQMDLSGPVEAAIEAGEVDEEFKLLPSWTKFAAHPHKSKGFFIRVLQSLFLGRGGNDELNVDLQTEKYTSEPRVAMMFVPANTRSEMMDVIGSICREALGGYNVIVLNGKQKYNGTRITNRNAEQIVREIVAEGKPTLIVAAQMAQRSFSIPEITELYLAYDQGDNGATIQKMSRTLTPGEIDKVGKIFSLSFDPNRDDKFDSMIVETALNYKSRSKVKSLRDSMREVLSTIDIFSCTPQRAIKIDIDTYLESALARKGISRVLGKIINLSDLPVDTVAALAAGNSDYFKAAKKNTVEKGKTKEANHRGEPKELSPKEKCLIAKARETIVTIVENIDIIMLSSDSKYIMPAIKRLDNKSDREWVLENYGVDLDVIIFLFENDIIKQDWIELLVEAH